MKAIRIQVASQKTDFYTSDFTDLITEIENAPDGEPITITVTEMTALEFNNLIQNHGANQVSER